MPLYYEGVGCAFGGDIRIIRKGKTVQKTTASITIDTVVKPGCNSDELVSMKLFTPRKIKVVAITLTSIIVLFAVAISMPWCGILNGNISYFENLPRPLVFMHLGKPFRIRQVPAEDREGYLKRGHVPENITPLLEDEIEVLYWDVSGWLGHNEGYRIYFTYLKNGENYVLINTHCNPRYPHW